MKHIFWNKHTKRIFKHVIGWFCILAGLIMLITPGQGIITLLIGVFILADEVRLFKKLKEYLQVKFPKVTQYAHLKIEQFKKKKSNKSTEDGE